MNAVDQKVRPLLAAFAANQPRRLSPLEQEALALWATKSVLGFFSKEPEGYRFAPRELYRELYRTRVPPPGSQLWLGGNPHGHMAWMGGHSLRLGGPLERNRGFGASLSFGHGVLYFMYHGSPDWLLRLRYEAHRALKAIWPTQAEVAWPPPLLTNPRDLSPLAAVINDNSAFVERKNAP